MTADDASATDALGFDLDGVGVHFAARGVLALDGVRLSVSAGEKVAVLGASGSGKTTLLGTLIGAVPTTGRVRVGDLDPNGERDRHRIRCSTGVLRQGADLVPVLSGRLNAVMGCAASFTAADWLALAASRPPRGLRERLHELARHHGVEECLDASVASLSGGQRQRIALIRAVLGRPRLLLADEPTTGLDPMAADRVVTDILGAATCTTVVTTHDLAVARRFGRIIGLRAGRVQYDGDTLDGAAADDLYRASR